MTIIKCDRLNRIFITGISGFLGASLGNILVQRKEKFSIIGIYNSYQDLHLKIPNLETAKSDIKDVSKLRSIVQKFKPDTIIHCAALRDLEYCQSHPKEAEHVNIQGTENIVQVCNEMDSKLIFISSDMVFPGDDAKYTETSKRRPINLYGETKKIAEDLVMNNLPANSWIIIRLSRLYGLHPLKRRLDFVGSLREKLEQKVRIKLQTDEYRNNTYIPWAAKMIIELCQEGVTGIFNVCGSECIDKFTFGNMIAEEFDLPTELITPITTDELNSRVNRPKKLLLDNSKLKTKVDELNLMPTIRDTLKTLKHQSLLEN